MRFRRPSILLALVLATACPGAATAQTAAPSGTVTTAPATTASATSSPDTDAMNDKARDLFREGTKLYRAQKWAQAEAAFEAAWALTDKKSKGLVNNLGQTEMHLGKWREAAEHLNVARRLAGKGDKQLPDIEHDLGEAKKKVGTLNVTSNVEGARVLVGEQVIGKAPLLDPVFVEPGKVTLSALVEGYEGVRVEVEVAAGQEVPVALELKKPAAVPSATPTASGGPVTPPPPRSIVPALVIGGVALVGLGVGGGLLGASRDQYETTRRITTEIHDAKGTCEAGAAVVDARCEDARKAATTSNMLRDGGIASLAVGGAAAVVALGYVLWPRSQARTGLQVTPVVGQTVGGFVVNGGF